MALIKEKQLDNGAVVSYWRVDMIAINKSRESANFALMGYHSKEVAERDGNLFLDCIGVSELMATEDKTMFNKYFRDKGSHYKDIDTACYMYAKEHVEFFKDAVDDEEYVMETLSA